MCHILKLSILMLFGAQAAVDFCNAVKQRRAQAQKVLCMCLSDSSIGYLDSCKGILGAELHALRTETHGNRCCDCPSTAGPAPIAITIQINLEWLKA